MRFLLIIFISTLLIGCVQQEVSFERKIWGNVVIEVNLKEISPSPNDVNDVYVYANIRLKNLPKHIETVDLNCFALKVNDMVSADIYFDGLGVMLTDRWPVIDNELSVRVYWHFESTIPMPLESYSFDVLVQKASVEECHK